MVGQCFNIHQKVSWEDGGWDEHQFMKKSFLGFERLLELKSNKEKAVELQLGLFMSTPVLSPLILSSHTA